MLVKNCCKWFRKIEDCLESVNLFLLGAIFQSDFMKMHVVLDFENERFQKISEQKIEPVQGSGHECSRSSFVRSVDVFR